MVHVHEGPGDIFISIGCGVNTSAAKYRHDLVVY